MLMFMLMIMMIMTEKRFTPNRVASKNVVIVGTIMSSHISQVSAATCHSASIAVFHIRFNKNVLS